jgi:hypothetical protein
MIFLSFFIVPLLIAIGGYLFFGKRITVKELLLQLFIQTAVVGIICSIVYYKNTTDTETWNGRVAAKTREKVSCGHSYPCRCRPVSCGKNCTTVHCDTCYEHFYDVDWDVRTTLNEGINIDRVDRQGLTEPPRWTSTKIGEPTSMPHSYTNYIKAAPDTIFRTQGTTAEAMPTYPQSYYDYYRLDRLVQIGTAVPDVAEWNKDLSELNADMGSAKQANIVITLVKGHGRDWYKTLERSWIGGKKNDVVLVIGLNSDDTIAWTETMAWTDYSYFRIKLRDDVLAIGKLDRAAIFAAIRDGVGKNFKRKPMSDFAYLAASVTPTGWENFWGLFFSILSAAGLMYWCEEQDIFGDEEREPRNDFWNTRRWKY